MDKQREEFDKLVADRKMVPAAMENVYWIWESCWPIAQAEAQQRCRETERLQQEYATQLVNANQKFIENEKTISVANQRIAELLDLVEVVERRNKQLEERIRVADAEEPVEIEYPEYHAQGMGCGLEDRDILDRYEAMRYGWECAIDAMAERIPDNLYLHAQIPAEVELKAKIAEPEAIIKASQEQELFRYLYKYPSCSEAECTIHWFMYGYDPRKST